MSKATNNAAELRRQITNVAKETERLQKELNRISAAEFPAAKAERFERGIQKSTEKVETLRKKLEEISGRKVETTEFQKISADLDAALEKIDKFYAEAQEKISGLGLPDDTDPAAVMSAKARADFEAACRTADELQEKYNAMRADGSRYQNMTETKEYKNTASQLAEAEQNLANETNAYNQAKADFQATQQESFQNTEADLNESLGKLGEMRSELQSVESSGQAFQRMGQIAKSAMSGVKQAVSTAVNGIKKLAGHVADATKKLGALAAAGVKNISGIGKHSKSSSNMVEQLGKRIWGLAKRVFVFSMITKGLRAIRSAFGEGLGYYSAWDKTLGASIQNLKNQVLVLKASIGGAFAPITQIVVPILSTLVGWLITATNAVGAFIARLTGKSTYKSVVAATAQAGTDAAKSVGDATDKVKELKKELADYDELHVIKNDEDNGSGGAGGGGGAGGSTGPGIEYQDTKISDGISDFADKIKEAWRNADFTEIGEILGTKLKEGLDRIPWDDIKNTAKRIGESLATLINGFVSVPGLAQTVGKTIGEAINTGISLANGFISRLEFNKIGKFLGEAINSFFSTWDADMQAENFYKLVNGIFDAIYAACDTIEWKEIGTKVGNCVKDALLGIKWKESVFPACDSFGSGLANFLNGLCGKDTFTAVGSTVANSLTAALHVLNSFGTTFKWKDFGQSLSSGLISFFRTFDWNLAAASFLNLTNGITRAINAALTDFNNQGGFAFVGTKVGQFLRRVLLNHDWNMTADNFSKLVTGIVEGIKSAIEEFGKNDGFYKVGLKIAEAIQGIDYSAMFDLVAETIWEALNAAIDLAKGLFEGTPFEDAFKKLDEFAENIDFETLKNGLQGILDVGLKFASGFMQGFLDAFTALAGIGYEVLSAIGSAFSIIGAGLSRIDPDLAKHIGYALGVVAAGLAAILIVSKVQSVITGIAFALGLAGPAGTAAAAGMGAAATNAGFLATAFTNLKSVASILFSPGGLFAAGVAGAVGLGEQLQILDEKGRGENGVLSEMGGIMDSIATRFSPKMADKIRDLKDNLENTGASTDECAEAFAELFKAEGVSPTKLTDAFTSVAGQINTTVEQQDLFNKTIAKMGPEAEESAKKLNITEEELGKLDDILWDVANDAGLGTQAKIQFDEVLAQNKGVGTAKDCIDALCGSMESMGIDTTEFVKRAKQDVPSAFSSISSSSGKASAAFGDIGTKAGEADQKTGTFKSALSLFAGAMGGNALLMAVIGTTFKGMADKATEAGGPVEKLKTTIKNFAAEAGKKESWKTDGGNIIGGLTEGIDQGQANLAASLAAALQKGHTTVETTEQMHSPSKVYEGYGKYLIAGLVNGVNAAKDSLSTAIKSVLSAAETEIKKLTGEGVKFDVKPMLQKISEGEIRKLKDQLLRETFEIKVTKLTQEIKSEQKKVKDGVIVANNVKDDLDAKKREVKNGKYIASEIKDSLDPREREIKNGKYIASEIKDDLDPREREIKNGKYMANQIKDELTAEKREIKNSKYIARDIRDEVNQKLKEIKNMTAVFKYFDDSITGAKNLKNFSAVIKDFTDQIWRTKSLKGFTAYVSDYSDNIWYSKRLYNFTAYVSYYSNAKGGVFSGGAWKSLPQYAGGGSPTHGTAFVAGENGAEIVGTINGRTEVLNKSQIAMAIYSAVRSAMQGFGTDIVKQIAYDSSVISAHIDAVAGYIPDVNNITQANRAYARTEGIDYNRLAQALQQNGGEANYTFTANLDGREIFRETVSQNDLYRTQTGRSAFA